MICCSFKSSFLRLRSLNLLKNVHQAFNSTIANKVIQSENNALKSQSTYLIVSGLSKFSCRNDLIKMMGSLEPDELDCLLDHSYKQTGDWALRYKNEDPDIVQAHLSNNCKDKVTSYRWVEDKAIDNFPLARKVGITNCSVIVRNVTLNVSTESLKHLFENYFLKSVIPLKTSSAEDHQQYILNFSTPEEAQRASVELHPVVVEGYPLKIHWYNI